MSLANRTFFGSNLDARTKVPSLSLKTNLEEKKEEFIILVLKLSTIARAKNMVFQIKMKLK